ncbi:MAG: hypothetical protein RL007_1073 [Bacteroidota bacterium]|jgi:hypothetical protein
MKKLIVFLTLSFAILLTGCVVLHYHYMRNLSEAPVNVTFIFDQSGAPSLPDSMYIRYSSSSHLVNGKTPAYMTDSLKVKKFMFTKMKFVIPSGGMIMLDKNTSSKIGYHDPLRIEIADTTGKLLQTVHLSEAPAANGKVFKSKGRFGQYHWHDIY